MVIVLVFVLAVGGLVTWNIFQAKKFDQELVTKQEQIEQVQQNLSESEQLIDALNQELVSTQAATEVERARVQKKLEDAKAERDVLLESAAALSTELQNAATAAQEAGRNVEDAQNKIQELEYQLEKAAQKKVEEQKKAEEEKASSLNSIINRNRQTKPNLK